MVEGGYLRMVVARSKWEDARRERAAQAASADAAQPPPATSTPRKPAPEPAAEAKESPQEQLLRNALTFASWQEQENMDRKLQAVTPKPPPKP